MLARAVGAYTCDTTGALDQIRSWVSRAARRGSSSSSSPCRAAPSSDPMELPAATLRVLNEAAAHSADGRTVALVFATHDFAELVLNWCLTAVRAGVRWFTVVAMDAELQALLERGGVGAPVVLLPRAQQGVPITKLNIIGERQRFGVQVLAAGLSVVHADADALFVRDPTPLLAEGDIVASRIWGKPLSVVRKWGAGVCTGFYFLRSSNRTVAFARSVQQAVAAKARSHADTWQQSDQYYVNTLLDAMGVTWSRGKMAGMADYKERMHSFTSDVGVAGGSSGAPLRLVMLPHVLAARACPVMKPGDFARAGAKPGGKQRLWQHLLGAAVVLHCFPPEKASAQAQAKRTIFMGHPEHIAGEEAFQRGQGLWLLRADWRQLPRPQPVRFDAWLASVENRSMAPALAQSSAAPASWRARKLAVAPASAPGASARPGSRRGRGARSRRRRGKSRKAEGS